MNAFVLDCSIVASWFLEDEVDRYSEHVLKLMTKSHGWVPSIFPAELSNVMLVSERQGRVPRVKCDQLIEQIAQLPISVDPAVNLEATSLLINIGREFKLSAYDAAYLELALRMEIPLASKDKQLKAAAKSCGLELQP